MGSVRSGRCAAAVLMVAFAGCATEAAVDAQESEFELYTYWTAGNDGNDFADTVKVVVDAFTAENPDVLVRNGAVSWSASGDYAGILTTRIAEDDAPDIWQVNGRHHVRSTADVSSAPIDEVYAEQDFVFSSEDLGINGQVYAIPMNVIRDNVIYVNLKVFREAGITDAELAMLKGGDAKVSDLFAVADKIAAHYATLGEGSGTPFGIYHAVSDVTSEISGARYPWTLKDAFLDCILPGTVGVQAWSSLLDQPATEKWKTPEVAEALTNLKHFIDRSNQDFLAGEPEAAPWNTLLDGRSAMVVLGDWYVSTLRASPLEYGKDWDAFACPGTAGTFIGHSDVWMMPPNAPHPENARKFLEIASTPEVQLAFNSKFGALPAVKVDESDLSEENGFGQYARDTYKELQTAGFTWRTESRVLGEFDFLSVLGPFADKVTGVNMLVDGALVETAVGDAMEGLAEVCTTSLVCTE